MQVIDWEEYIDSHSSFLTSHSSLALTVGVFDGIHLGHQVLIRKICARTPETVSIIPAVITFKQNPLKIIKAESSFSGDIYTLDQKLCVFKELGVQLTVLIDFSRNFSKISGREFIDLLLGSRPVKLIAVGRNFRCGHNLDTGAGEIQNLAGMRGIETWIAEPVMDGGYPVSSSRIRQALASGQKAEAERLLGRSM